MSTHRLRTPRLDRPAAPSVRGPGPEEGRPAEPVVARQRAGAGRRGGAPELLVRERMS